MGRMIKFFLLIWFGVSNSLYGQINLNENDSLALGQAYINLALTTRYFDSISSERLSSILVYEEKILKSFEDSLFIKNGQLYYFSKSLWYYLKTQEHFNAVTIYDRATLLTLKNRLDKSIRYFNRANSISFNGTGSFYEFIEFSSEAFSDLEKKILRLKEQLANYYFEDIYLDYKRLFLTSVKNKVYHFDSLEYYNNLYNIPFELETFNKKHEFLVISARGLSNSYQMPYQDLELMSTYLQFDSMVNKATSLKDTNYFYILHGNFEGDLLLHNKSLKGRNDIVAKDSFFTTYLNDEITKELYKEIEIKFPIKELEFSDVVVDYSSGYDYQVGGELEKYYFPTPAPFTATKKVLKKYKPALLSVGQVCGYMEGCFYNAGYEDHLNYFYLKIPGFAIVTDLERINKNGSPVSGSQRWDLKQPKLTLFGMLEAAFLQKESEFRMIACLVSSHEYLTSNDPEDYSSLPDFNFLKKSYSSLPNDLESSVLDTKTITLLIYHFTQNDVGKVPELSLNTAMTVTDHLNNTSGLSRLISTN